MLEEKKDAVERGVRDRMKHFESEMIDEMMQAALNLDVDAEVEARVNAARTAIENKPIEESDSKSGSYYYNRTSNSKSAKKNVKFQSPKNVEKQSSATYSEKLESSMSKRSGKLLGHSMGTGDHDRELTGESIDESIQ